MSAISIIKEQLDKHEEYWEMIPVQERDSLLILALARMLEKAHAEVEYHKKVARDLQRRER